MRRCCDRSAIPGFRRLLAALSGRLRPGQLVPPRIAATGAGTIAGAATGRAGSGLDSPVQSADTGTHGAGCEVTRTEHFFLGVNRDFTAILMSSEGRVRTSPNPD